jgi:hypothetical protein
MQRSIEKDKGKNFRFTLTTNGVLIDDDVIDFANREMYNVVMSLDGRKEIHDRSRRFQDGRGSNDLIVPKFKEHFSRREGKGYYIKGRIRIATSISRATFFIWPIWDLRSFPWSPSSLGGRTLRADSGGYS